MDINGVMKDYKQKDLKNEVVYYCTRCLSLYIVGNASNTDLWCESCGRSHSHPKYIDVTTMDKWLKLYMDAKGHHPLDAEPTIYDDLDEVYMEQAENPEPTKDEIIAEGLNYSEKMNRRIKD